MVFRALLALSFCVASRGFVLPYIGWKLPSMQIPSLDMSMQFPSIFGAEDPLGQAMESNTEAAMDREFNMDDNMPSYKYAFKMPEVNTTSNDTKTSRKVKHKDGYKIITTETKFPGGQSVMQTMEKEGNDTGKSFSMSNLEESIGESDLSKMNQFIPTETKGKCKCGKDEFCDPLFGKCHKKLPEGATCAMKKQCKAGLMCVWGKCNKGKAGDPGTFCKKKEECKGEACCVKKPGQYHAICTPLGAETAICGNKMEGFLNIFQVKQVKETCNPCKKGLKCATTGDSTYKRCLPESFVEEPKLEDKKGKDEDKKDDKSDGKDDGSSDEDSSDDDDDEKSKLSTNAAGKIPIKLDPPNKSAESKKKKPKSKREKNAE